MSINRSLIMALILSIALQAIEGLLLGLLITLLVIISSFGVESEQVVRHIGFFSKEMLLLPISGLGIGFFRYILFNGLFAFIGFYYYSRKKKHLNIHNINTRKMLTIINALCYILTLLMIYILVNAIDGSLGFFQSFDIDGSGVNIFYLYGYTVLISTFILHCIVLQANKIKTKTKQIKQDTQCAGQSRW